MAPTFRNCVSKEDYEQVQYSYTFAKQHKIDKMKEKKARKLLRNKIIEEELE